MSRIGRKPVVVNEKVKARVENGSVFVEGPLGKLSFALPDGIQAAVKDGHINLSVAAGATGKAALFGTIRFMRVPGSCLWGTHCQHFIRSFGHFFISAYKNCHFLVLNVGWS